MRPIADDHLAASRAERAEIGIGRVQPLPRARCRRASSAPPSTIVERVGRRDRASESRSRRGRRGARASARRRPRPPGPGTAHRQRSGRCPMDRCSAPTCRTSSTPLASGVANAIRGGRRTPASRSVRPSDMPPPSCPPDSDRRCPGSASPPTGAVRRALRRRRRSRGTPCSCSSRRRSGRRGGRTGA